MTYFVTGSTGFLGRFLLQTLLAREPARAHRCCWYGRRRANGWRASSANSVAPSRVTLYEGDLIEPRLGLSDADVDELRGNVDHFFHLAAVYDMTADDERNQAANVEGTRNAVELANALRVGCLHHVSSIAVAGEYDGYFREDMFDEGQPLPSSYHRTKFESERLVRTPRRGAVAGLPPGDRRRAQQDRRDGQDRRARTTSSSPSRRCATCCPSGCRWSARRLGDTNIVPVDYVIAAMDHIAHQPGLDGQAFHLTNPRRMSSGDVINIFARAAHAPQLALRIDKPLLDLLPKGVLSAAMKLPALRQIRRQMLSDLGVPEEVLEHIALVPRFDTRDTERALDGSGIAVPELADYAPALWDYWERHLDPGSAPRSHAVRRGARPHRRHHRRFQRHRPGRRAAARRRRGDPDPGRAQRRQTGGGARRDRRGGRRGLHVLGRPRERRRHRGVRRSNCSPTTRASTCW